MPQQVSSRESIKHDRFQEFIMQSLEWVGAHRQTFFSVVGTVAVIALVAGFTIANFSNLRKQAWERYFAGQDWLMAGNVDNGLNLFNEVVNNYGHTPAAAYALLTKGDVLYRQRKLKEAVETYQACLKKDPSNVLKPFVISALGIALEDSGDFTQAIENYKKFLADYPDHYLAPKISESLARAYELTRNPDAAKEIYEKIITQYPGSLWSENARNRYQRLAPRPFESASDQPANITGSQPK